MDICSNNYAEGCADIILQTFPGRFRFIKGDSKQVLPVLFFDESGSDFGIVHIDGGRGALDAKVDVSNAPRFWTRVNAYCLITPIS